MIKTLNILFVVLLAAPLYAAESQWQGLIPMDQYSVGDFNLNRNMGYVEIRQYQVDEQYKLKKKSYKTVLSFYRTPLTSFDPETVIVFRKLVSDFSENIDFARTDIEDHGVGCYYRYNGFLLADNGEISRINTIEGIIGLLGEIDTPAEVQTVLWLYNKHPGEKYRKIADGYEVLVSYTEEYGDAQSYCRKLKYRATISSQGEITGYKLMQTETTGTYCMHVDWLPCD